MAHPLPYHPSALFLLPHTHTHTHTASQAEAGAGMMSRNDMKSRGKKKYACTPPGVANPYVGGGGGGGRGGGGSRSSEPQSATYREPLNLRVTLEIPEAAQGRILDTLVQSMVLRGADLPDAGKKKKKKDGAEEGETEGGAEEEAAAEPLTGYSKDLEEEKMRQRVKRRLLRRITRQAKDSAREKAQEQQEATAAAVPGKAAASSSAPTAAAPSAPAAFASAGTVRVSLTNAAKPSVPKVQMVPRGTTLKELLTLAAAKLSLKNSKKKPVWVHLTNDASKEPLENTAFFATAPDGIALTFSDAPVSAEPDKKEKKEKKDKEDKKEKKEKKEKKDKKEKKEKEEAEKAAAADESAADEGDEDEEEVEGEAERWKRQEAQLRTSHSKEGGGRTMVGESLLKAGVKAGGGGGGKPFAGGNPRLAAQRKSLPAHAMRTQLLDTIRSSQVTIVVGHTGSGKTTQVPQYLLEDALEKKERVGILCTQPRRIAAISIAERVSQEHDCKVGGAVGYNVRFGSCYEPQSTKLGFLTTGILLSRLQTDPYLTGVTHLVLDEVHERSLHMDLVLNMLKTNLAEGRLPDLKIILLSATINAELFGGYFTPAVLAASDAAAVPAAGGKKKDKKGGAAAGAVVPVLTIPGKTYPVTINFLEDVYATLGLRRAKNDDTRRALGKDELSQWLAAMYGGKVRASPPVTDSDAIDYRLAASLVQRIAKTRKAEEHQAGILVFLPGAGEIQKLQQELQKSGGGALDVVALHAQLSNADQRRAFTPARPNAARVVLATNIAETSVTIDGITDVIDTGHVKEMRHSSSMIQSLSTYWVSHANATQRAGRAGRVMPGTCWRLYDKSFYDAHLPEQPLCEIRRTNLSEAVLFAAMVTPDASDIPAFLGRCLEPPADSAVQAAFGLLMDLGAFHEMPAEAAGAAPHRFVTPLGFHLAHMPVDPHLGKILLYGAALRCGALSAAVAAVLSAPKSVFAIPFVAGRPSREEEARANEVRRDGYADVGSDPIAKALIFCEWEGLPDERARRQFVDTYTLSHGALVEVRKLRDMYLQHIRGLGFTVADGLATDPKRQARDEAMARCAIVAGLYPNVACSVKGVSMLVSLRSRELCMVNNKSLNYQEDSRRAGGLGSALSRNEFVVYLAQMRFGEMRHTLVTETTLVTAMQLLLFGGKESPDLCLKPGTSNLSEDMLLDGVFRFACPCSQTAVLVRVVRQEIDELFAAQALTPSSDAVKKTAGVLVDAIASLLQV